MQQFNLIMDDFSAMLKLIINQVGILYPIGVPSAPFDILESRRLFSTASRCGRCPFVLALKAPRKKCI